MSDHYEPPRSWTRKFGNAFRGLIAREQVHSSFLVHAVVSVAVIALGVWLQVTLGEWCLLALCIAAVLAAELFNTSIESLARAVTKDYDEHIRDALDISSAAVLLTALAAVVVGCIIFLPRLAALVG